MSSSKIILAIQSLVFQFSGKLIDSVRTFFISIQQISDTIICYWSNDDIIIVLKIRSLTFAVLINEICPLGCRFFKMKHFQLRCREQSFVKLIFLNDGDTSVAGCSFLG